MTREQLLEDITQGFINFVDELTVKELQLLSRALHSVYALFQPALVSDDYEDSPFPPLDEENIYAPRSDVRDLHARLNDLYDMVQKLHTQQEVNTSNIISVGAAQDELRRYISALFKSDDDSIAVIQETLKVACENIKALDDRIDRSIAIDDKVLKQLRDKIEELKTYQAQVKELDEKVTRVLLCDGEVLQRMSNQIEDLNTYKLHISTLADRVNRLDIEFAAAQKLLTEHRGAINRQRAGHTADTNLMNERFDVLNSTVASLATRINQAFELIGYQPNESSVTVEKAMAHQRAETSNAIKRLQSQLDELSLRLDTQNGLKPIEAQIAAKVATTEPSRTFEKFREIYQRVYELDVKYNDLNSRLINLRIDAIGHNTEMNGDLNTELQQVRYRLDGVEEQLGRHQNRLSELQDSLAQCEVTDVEVHTQLHELRDKYRVLDQCMDSFTTALRASNAKLADILTQVRQEVNEADDDSEEEVRVKRTHSGVDQFWTYRQDTDI